MCESKPVPHKHAAVIKAWADGHVVQLKMFRGEWADLDIAGGDSDRTPSFDTKWEYRIKPEPSDLERYGVEVGDVWRLCASKLNPLGYTCHTVAKLTDVTNHYRCTEGCIRTVTSDMTLMFRRGVVNKL